jgi:hypothetical protein
LCGGPGRPGFGGRLTRSIQPQRARIRKFLERDCAESQSQQCERIKTREHHQAVGIPTLLRLVCDTAAIRAWIATVCEAPVAAASPAGTRGNKFERVELRTLLRLTEPRSGPRVCEAQRFRWRARRMNSVFESDCCDQSFPLK